MGSSDKFWASAKRTILGIKSRSLPNWAEEGYFKSWVLSSSRLSCKIKAAIEKYTRYLKGETLYREIKRQKEGYGGKRWIWEAFRNRR